jgi:hypothetical protein
VEVTSKGRAGPGPGGKEGWRRVVRKYRRISRTATPPNTKEIGLDEVIRLISMFDRSIFFFLSFFLFCGSVLGFS